MGTTRLRTQVRPGSRCEGLPGWGPAFPLGACLPTGAPPRPPHETEAWGPPPWGSFSVGRWVPTPGLWGQVRGGVCCRAGGRGSRSTPGTGVARAGGARLCSVLHVREPGQGAADGFREVGDTWDRLGRRGGRGCRGVWVPGWPWVPAWLWVSGCQHGRGCRAQVYVLGRGCRSGSWWQLVGDSAQVPGPRTASGRGLCPVWRGRSGEAGCLLLEELSL